MHVNVNIYIQNIIYIYTIFYEIISSDVTLHVCPRYQTIVWHLTERMLISLKHLCIRTDERCPFVNVLLWWTKVTACPLKSRGWYCLGDMTLLQTFLANGRTVSFWKLCCHSLNAVRQRQTHVTHVSLQYIHFCLERTPYFKVNHI